MKKKDTLLTRVFILLTIINFNLKVFSQLTNLSEIQNDLSVKKTEFPKHYNYLVKKFINTRDSLITTKELLVKKHSASVDSINNLIEKNKLLIEANRIKLNNFNTLISTIDNKPVALITEKKHKKSFNEIIGTDYPIKIIFKDIEKQESYQLISVDNKTGELLKIQEIQGNKKINKIYTDFAESNKLTYVTRNEILLWTDSKIAVDANMANSILHVDLNSLEKLHKTEGSRLDIEINTYNLDVLKSKRLADSTNLNELTQYYTIDYPKAIKEYNKNLALEKEKDKLLIDTYNQDLAKYNATAGFCTKMPTEDEARVYFNQFKTALKDPYSAILETYGIKKAKKTNEKYPCIKIVQLGVRAKNSWGAYNKSTYWVAVKDELVIDYGDMENWDAWTSDYSLSLAFEMNSVSCNNTLFSEPVYPKTAEQRLSKPVMKEYVFKFSLN